MTDSILGRHDGKIYKTEECPKCGDPMKIVSKNYWIDEYKMAKQVKYLEEHKNLSFCFHPVKLQKK